jgi:hypothetical protein
MRSFIIASIVALASLTLATPVTVRDTQHIDVFVSEASSDSHAIQAVIGEVKSCIGDNGFPPCEALSLSISPNDATVDLTTVSCTAFSDTEATYPIGFFGDYDELNFYEVTSVGSVLCETY